MTRSIEARWFALLLPLLSLASAIHTGCTSSDGDANAGGYGTSSGTGSTSGGSSGASATCKDMSPGTNFAACVKDSDCFSGYCDQSGKPGPYCAVPTHKARANGSGYGCTSDADCESVAPSFVSAGGAALCRNDDVYAGCTFGCP